MFERAGRPIMALVVPNKDRVTVEDCGANLRITMYVAAPPVVPTTLGISLVFLLFAEISGLIALWNGGLREGEHFQLPWMTEAISSGADFTYLMLSWLAFGAAMSALLASLFMWTFAGKEIIELNSRTLKHIRKIPVFSHSREYSVANIARLRLVPFPWNTAQKFLFFGLGEEAIAFDYGPRIHRLGVSLDEANAHYVLQKMRERVTSLGR
jgi:hypothetical protein